MLLRKAATTAPSYTFHLSGDGPDLNLVQRAISHCVLLSTRANTSAALLGTMGYGMACPDECRYQPLCVREN